MIQESTIPQDATAEASVVGSFVLAPDEIRRTVADTVKPEAFMSDEQRVLFGCVVDMWRKRKPIDGVTLRAELQARGEWGKAVNLESLQRAFDSVPSAANAVHYARIVRDHHRRRWVYERATKAAQSAWQTDSDPIAVAAQLRDKLATLVQRATAVSRRDGGAEEHRRLMDATIAGERYAVAWPHKCISRMTKALLPGTLTVICGKPGDGKTWLLHHCLMWWMCNGITVASFQLEGERAWHLNRCLAVLAEDGTLLDDDTVKANPDWASKHQQQHAETLEIVGECIFEKSGPSVSLETLSEWVEAEAPNRRVMIIDPITLASAGKDRFIADEAFVARAQDAIKRSGSSLILVTHPKATNGRPPDMDDLGGGKIYSRAADCVMWLKALDKYTQFRMHCNPHGESDIRSANRVMRILKARNARGAGLNIGFDFKGASVSFTELGIIEKEESEVEV